MKIKAIKGLRIISYLFLFFFLIFSVQSISSEDLAAYRKALLERTNYYRKLHCVEGLVEDDPLLTKVAQDYTEKLENEIKTLQHNGNRQAEYGNKGWVGENAYWTSSKKSTTTNVVKAIDSWYNEIAYYDFTTGKNKPGTSGTTGHFTQLVWKNSKKVGFGIAEGDAGVFVVADYFPGGNYNNDYIKNCIDSSVCSGKPKGGDDGGDDDGKKKKEEGGLSGFVIFLIVLGSIIVVAGGFLAFLYFQNIDIAGFSFRNFVDTKILKKNEYNESKSTISSNVAPMNQ